MIASRAFRAVVRSPLSVLTLAVGIGSLSAAYALVDAAFWPPTGIPSPDELFVVTDRTSATPSKLSEADAASVLGRLAPMATVATWSTHSAVLRTDNAGRRVLFELVSPGYFSTLGLEPVDGRLMSTADAADQGAPAAVVSLALSRALFKSSHDAVGARALLGGTEVVIVGVVPSTFRGVSGASDVWLPDSNRPIATTGAAGAPRQRGVAIRLRSQERRRGAAAALSDLAATLNAVDASGGPARSSGSAAAARPWTLAPAVRNPSLSAAPGTLAVFLLVPALVFIVACNNVGCVFFARNLRRLPEFSIRRALGASEARVLLAALALDAPVVLAGALLGIVAGHIGLIWALGQINSLQLDGAVLDPGLRWRTVVFAITLAAVALAIASALPASRVVRSGARMSDAPRRMTRRTSQGPFLAVQVMIGVGLFLLASGVRNQVASATGGGLARELEATGLVSVGLGSDDADGAALADLATSLSVGLHRDTGDATWAAVTDLRTVLGRRTRAAIDVATIASDDATVVQIMGATIGVFQLLDLDLEQGRQFRLTASGEVPEAVIDRELASRLYGGQGALGQPLFIRLSDGGRRSARQFVVVGVVRARTGLRFEGVPGFVMVPLSEYQDDGSVSVLVRAQGIDERVVAVRTAALIRSAVPWADVGFVGPALDYSLSRRAVLKVLARVSTGLGILCLILAMTGLYGVLSQFVNARRRELAVRTALGASPGAVIAAVFGTGLPQVGVGLLLALALALTTEGLWSALGMQGPLVGWPSYTVATVLAVGATCIACSRPALLALRLDPARELQADD